MEITIRDILWYMKHLQEFYGMRKNESLLFRIYQDESCSVRNSIGEPVASFENLECLERTLSNIFNLKERKEVNNE